MQPKRVCKACKAKFENAGISIMHKLSWQYDELWHQCIQNRTKYQCSCI